MKKILLILSFLLPLSAFAMQPSRTISRSDVSSIVSDFRHYDGVEVVRLGRLVTGAAKGVLRLAGGMDADAQQVISLMNGLNGLTILEYEDAAPEVRARLDNRIARVLRKSELLMEARENGNGVMMYGTVDEKSGKIRNFVMHSPDGCALICFFGTLSVDALKALMEND